MNDVLPAPLTPPDCDMRNYPYMPLDVVRLRDSEFAALESGEAYRCGSLLWAASWHQVPAASVPNDDVALARLAGYGRGQAAVNAFAQARADGAMRGWVLCSDNRWYHPVVAEKAIEGMEAKRKQAERTAAATKARRSTSEHRHDQRDDPPTVNRDDKPTSTVTTDVTFTKENKENKESKEVVARVCADARDPPEGELLLLNSPKAEPSRQRPPDTPRIGDQCHRWEPLADGAEIDEQGRRRPLVAGWRLDACAERVLDLAKINPVSWRGDWQPLIGWLKAGIHMDVIERVVRELAARPNYTPATTLKYFDAAIRKAAGLPPP
jgi:hypothetical protein